MVIKCSKCDYEVENSIGLKIHNTKVHGTGKKVFCKICSKPFASRQSLCTHMKKHKKEEQIKEAQLVISDTKHQELKDKITEEMILQLQQLQHIGGFMSRKR